MPEESTAADIMNAYIESWKLGLKAVAAGSMANFMSACIAGMLL